MSNVIDMEARRAISQAMASDEIKSVLDFDVLFMIYHYGGKITNVHIPGLRIVHWRDETSNTWETEVASLALSDDEKPNIVVMSDGLVDCLTLIPDEDLKSYRYYVRKPFLAGFSEALAGMGHPSVSTDDLVVVTSKRVQSAPFNHARVQRQQGQTIVAGVDQVS